MLACAQSACDAPTRCHTHARPRRDPSYHTCMYQRVPATHTCCAAGHVQSIAGGFNSIVRKLMNRIDFSGPFGYDSKAAAGVLRPAAHPAVSPAQEPDSSVHSVPCQPCPSELSLHAACSAVPHRCHANGMLQCLCLCQDGSLKAAVASPRPQSRGLPQA